MPISTLTSFEVFRFRLSVFTYQVPGSLLFPLQPVNLVDPASSMSLPLSLTLTLTLTLFVSLCLYPRTSGFGSNNVIKKGGTRGGKGGKDSFAGSGQTLGGGGGGRQSGRRCLPRLLFFSWARRG